MPANLTVLLRQIFVFVALTACGGREPGALTDPGFWSMSQGGDPFPEHALAYEGCPFAEAGAFFEEAGVLEVDTGRCGYLVLQQPSVRAVRAGDTLLWTVSHAPLVAAEPATAHIAIALDGAVLWDFNVDIPFPAEVFDLSAEAPAHARADSTVTIHIHNHGENAWTFSEGRVEPQ